ncbi:MAG: calcium-binding protein [Bythopirellula sp.]|nr:calcium-binding protein [Bythopirellula sp.]
MARSYFTWFSKQRSYWNKKRKSPSAAARGLRKLMTVEPLEDRRMLAVSAMFAPATSTLNVFGDSGDNTIVVSRDSVGALRVNGGAVNIVGGTPTIANTTLIQAFGLAGNDVISLDETNGALPAAKLFGGGGQDTLTGGSGGDQLFGQSGDDDLLGKGGTDLMFGGSANDDLTGGDADDQAFGQNGSDTMVWNPGDDTDLNEGGGGVDTVTVNGGGGDEVFTTTANGTRVRFDRVNPAPFSLDIGTSENLVVNANGGNDSFSATGNLAALIAITVDGGAGNDTLLGSNGVDLLIGSDNEDFIDGQQGNDMVFMGAGNDNFQWDPGDGSDTIEGQDGLDKMIFNGSNGAEIMEVAANGSRVRFTRNLGSIVMDLDDVEVITTNALGSTDTIIVNDMSGTDLTEFNLNLAGTIGGTTGDAQADSIIVNGTNGEDVIFVTGSGGNAAVLGLATVVNIAGAESATDRVTVNALGGDDVVDATGLEASAIQLTADGGADDDVLQGGDGADTLLGGEGDDVLVGGPGLDILDGGLGDNVVIQ